VWIDVDEVMRATTSEPASLSLLDGELLEDLVGIDPTFDMWLTAERERLRERGMAIQAYDRCRTVLADLLDAAPSAETQKLLTEIRGPSSTPAGTLSNA